MRAKMSRFIIVSMVLRAVATATATHSNGRPLSSSGLIIGYPGVFSRDHVRVIVDEEMRKQLLDWSEISSAKARVARQTKAGRSHGKRKGALRQRSLKKAKEDDLSGLNEILESFEFDIPEDTIQLDFLGSTATFVVSGQCSDIKIRKLGLDYESKGEDLTYQIDIQDLDVACTLDVTFDFGAYDIEDELTIDIKLADNDFALSVVLEGIPPEKSWFRECDVELNIEDIKAEGGFSANILNDLDYVISDLVESEKPVISELLCDQVSGFTSLVDGLLMTVMESIEPYLGKPESVDPLEVEKNLQVPEGELVDFMDSDLGYAISVIADNLKGVFGPYQVNTLVELNLLDENAVYVLDFTESEEERRSLQGEECALFRRGRRNLMSDFIQQGSARRSLQLGDDDAEQEIFTVNSLDVLSIELAGLNTFTGVDLLKIIGQYTFTSKFKLSRVTVKAIVLLNADVNGVNIEETIEVTVPIVDIDIIASYLVGLTADVVQETDLGRLLNSGDIFSCVLTALEALGLSELTVSVGGIGIPTVVGALSSGVDELINTATEAAIIHYQKLIVDEAIPNIAQKNVTVQFNEFAECFIRTEAAVAVCPEPESQDVSSSGFFSFRRLEEMIFG